MSRQTRRKDGRARGNVCSRKTGIYTSMADARRAARAYMKYNPGSLEKVAYPCPYCNQFHFGSRVDRRGR